MGKSRNTDRYGKYTKFRNPKKNKNKHKGKQNFSDESEGWSKKDFDLID